MSDIKEVMTRIPSRPKPSIRLTQKELPAIKDWKVGGKYTITLKVEQTSAEKDDDYGDEKGLCARFKILKATTGEEYDD